METDFEYILLNSYKANMISYLESHPEDFEEAIQLAISNKQLYSKKAAWLLWSCMKKNDQRIKKYIKSIINILPLRPDEHQRDLLIILHKMELNDGFEGKLFNICVNIWKIINKKPSVRYNAFKLVIKIAKSHPDLTNEVIFLTQDQYLELLSVTVKKSISKMLSEL